MNMKPLLISVLCIFLAQQRSLASDMNTKFDIIEQAIILCSTSYYFKNPVKAEAFLKGQFNLGNEDARFSVYLGALQNGFWFKDGSGPQFIRTRADAGDKLALYFTLHQLTQRTPNTVFSNKEEALAYIEAGAKRGDNAFIERLQSYLLFQSLGLDESQQDITESQAKAILERYRKEGHAWAEKMYKESEEYGFLSLRAERLQELTKLGNARASEILKNIGDVERKLKAEATMQEVKLTPAAGNAAS